MPVAPFSNALTLTSEMSTTPVVGSGAMASATADLQVSFVNLMPVIGCETETGRRRFACWGMPHHPRPHAADPHSRRTADSEPHGRITRMAAIAVVSSILSVTEPRFSPTVQECPRFMIGNTLHLEHT
ncbi:hypothetical protein ABIB56_000013 [Glaciihabitans sp. UYNi722]